MESFISTERMEICSLFGLCYSDVMKTLIRNVKDMEAADRSTMERIVGEALGDNQRLIIQVSIAENLRATASENKQSTASLPSWCNIYEGLSVGQIDDLADSIVRCDSSRLSPLP